MEGKKPRMSSRTDRWRRKKQHWAAGQRRSEKKNSDREQDRVTENQKTKDRTGQTNGGKRQGEGQTNRGEQRRRG